MRLNTKFIAEPLGGIILHIQEKINMISAQHPWPLPLKGKWAHESGTMDRKKGGKITKG